MSDDARVDEGRVEAAAEAMWDWWWTTRDLDRAKEAWCDLGSIRRDYWRDEARAALAAADRYDRERGATDAPSTFVLVRSDDETGVSGTGRVAWGCVFPDGVAVTRWAVSDIRQTCVWRSLADIREIHGHGGKTEVVWVSARHHSEAEAACERLAAERDALSVEVSRDEERAEAEKFDQAPHARAALSEYREQGDKK